MAWKLDVKQDTGVVVNFWQIEKITVNAIKNTVEISYQGWVSQSEKDLGAIPVVSSSYHLNHDLSLKVTSDFLSLCEQIVRSDIFPASEGV